MQKYIQKLLLLFIPICSFVSAAESGSPLARVQFTPATSNIPLELEAALQRTPQAFSPARTGRWSAYMSKFKSNKDLVEHLHAALGEYIGTTMFLFLAFFPVNYINTHQIDASSALMYNSLAFGFALTITARAFASGHFNSAVTLSLALQKIITPVRAVILAIAQYTGSLTAAGIVRLLAGSLQTATRKTDINIGQALVLEMLGTASLIFSILMLSAKEKSVNILAPIEIGLSLFITELMTIGYSGGALSSNRALSVDIVNGDFAGYSWIYHVGPLAGGALATGVYKFLEALQELRENVPEDPPFGLALAKKVADTDAHRPLTGLEVMQGRRRGSSNSIVTSPIGQHQPRGSVDIHGI